MSTYGSDGGFEEVRRPPTIAELRRMVEHLRHEVQHEREQRGLEVGVLSDRLSVADGLNGIGAGLNAVIDALQPLRSIVPPTTTAPLTEEQLVLLDLMRRTLARPDWGTADTELLLLIPTSLVG